jgi:signal transduction histidine kinase
MTSGTRRRHPERRTISAVKMPRAQTLWRVGGLVAIAMAGLEATVSLVASPPPEVPPAAVAVTGGVVVLFVAAFGAAFWVVTSGTDGRLRRLDIALLLLQMAFGYFVSTDFLYVVAAELGSLLAPRLALVAMSVQLVLTLVVGGLAARTPDFEIAAGYVALPRSAAVALSLASSLAWQLFAFCVGYLAAAELRGRRELALRNAELLGTQDLLAEGVRLAERLGIARELHDAAGHHLTALTIHLELARRTSEGRPAEAIEKALSAARLLLAEVRDVVSALRRDRAVDLVTALRRLADAAPEPKIDVTVPEGLDVPPRFAPLLLRCAQEGVTNALRHARAATVRVILEPATGNGGIRLVVRDDGRGAAAPVPGHGLAGMRERVEGAGGRLAFATAPGQGFALTVDLSWRPGEVAT